ncbi:MAG TPA: FecR domain-containing protein, partial [Coleofasciculaceae cyanobacterium]
PPISVMKTHTLRHCYAGLVTLALSGFLVGCSTLTPKTSASSPEVDSISSPTASPLEEAPAILSEISQQPVWVQLLNTTNETTADKGISLRVGEKIRTHKEGVAQVDFKNGLAFRLGGDSVVSLEPNNHLKLSEGEILVWVDPGQKVPTEIITRGAIAKLQGTTVSVKILKELDHAVEIFVWEGTVTVQIPNQTGAITLNSGQEVRIWSGETDIQQVRQRIRRVPYQDWSHRRFQSPLLNNFSKPLPTLLALDQASPPVTAPETSKVSRTRELNINFRKPTISRSNSRFNQPANLGLDNRTSTSRRTQQVTRNQATTRTPIRRSSQQANRTSRPTQPQKLDLGSYFPDPQSTPTPTPTQLPSPQQTEVSESIRRLIRQTNSEVETGIPTPSPTPEATSPSSSTDNPDRILIRQTTPSVQPNNPTPSLTQETTPPSGSTDNPDRILIRQTTPSVQPNNPTPSPIQEATPTNRPTRSEIENETNRNTPIEQATPVESENTTPTPSPSVSPIESLTPESPSPIRSPMEEVTPASPIPGKTDRAGD